ncbi:PilZ domain-containing protein [Erythrobacter sp. NFXS35]|uniref:PilZ domain-containing protein n=1 Tax=Erythrobacter sp. NFXS35 TaxID=2818436 RepID=UPI0032DEE175
MAQPFTFTEPAVAGEPAQASATGRRGAARLRLSIPVRVISTRANQPCVLLDLSRTGARIGLATPLRPGELIYLNVARLEVFAEVVRRHCGQAGGVNGLAFDDPLPDAAVLAVRRHAETLEQRERNSLRDQVRRWVSGEKLT